MEATQDKVIEDIGEPRDYFLFLGNVNSPSNLKNLSACVDFEIISNNFKKSSTPNKSVHLAMDPTLIPNMHGTCIIN